MYQPRFYYQDNYSHNLVQLILSHLLEILVDIQYLKRIHKAYISKLDNIDTSYENLELSKFISFIYPVVQYLVVQQRVD